MRLTQRKLLSLVAVVGAGLAIVCLDIRILTCVLFAAASVSFYVAALVAVATHGRDRALALSLAVLSLFVMAWLSDVPVLCLLLP